MLITIYFLIILIFEIVVIIRALKEKNKKHFKIFNGLFFGFLISIILYCIYFSTDVYSYDTGEWIALEAFIKSLLFCIINVVMGLIGLIFQVKSRKRNFIEPLRKGITIKYILKISVVSFIILFSQFIVRYSEKNMIENEVKEETIIYLKDKYGTDAFEIKDIDRKFSANGWIETDYLEYYEVKVLHKESNIEFVVELDVDDERKILRDSSGDWLLFAYYGKEFEDDDFRVEGNIKMLAFADYLKHKNLNVKLEMSKYYSSGSSSDKIMPSKYGKIPTKNEFYNLIIDYQLKHEMKIIIDKNELVGKNLEKELRDYLVNLANYIIDYYDEVEDYQIYCEYYGEDEFFKGNMYINKEYINIDVGSIEEKIKR